MRFEMWTCFVAGSLLLFLAAPAVLAADAQADSITYTDQGVTFDLVGGASGGTVTATLTIQTNNDTDYLKYVGIKIFADDPPAWSDFDNSYGGTGSSTPDDYDGTDGYEWISGYRVGAPTGSIQGSDGGWVGADHTGNGLAMDASTYVFVFEWDTDEDWIDEWSIKMWTAESDGTKSRQWSSGGITPVPEPGSLALLGLGLTGFATWRRRRPAR